MSLFFLQLKGELLKLFARKRTYIGFGAFIVVEIVILRLLQLEKVQKTIAKIIEQAGYTAEDYLSGLTLAFMILLWTVFLLGSLYLSLVSGDVVSKEVEDGTLRMMLCRPISRARIIAVKVVACAIYTAALILFIAVTALVTGFAHGGVGGLFIFAPMEGIFAVYDFWDGLARYALALPMLIISVFTITAMGFFFSCQNMKPAAATIVTLSILFVDMIVKNIPFFESIRHFFLTTRMSGWVKIFEHRIPWEKLLEDYTWLMAVNATLILLGWLAFERRDFKS